MTALSKFGKYIILLVVFVLIFGILLYLTLRLKRDKKNITDSNTPSPSEISLNFDSNIFGKFKGISEKKVSIEVNGETRVFTTPQELFYICAVSQPDEYTAIKQTNADGINSSIMIDVSNLSKVIKDGESVNVFLYKYSETVTYVKGIVSLECS